MFSPGQIRILLSFLIFSSLNTRLSSFFSLIIQDPLSLYLFLLSLFSCLHFLFPSSFLIFSFHFSFFHLLPLPSVYPSPAACFFFFYLQVKVFMFSAMFLQFNCCGRLYYEIKVEEQGAKKTHRIRILNVQLLRYNDMILLGIQILCIILFFFTPCIYAFYL